MNTNRTLLLCISSICTILFSYAQTDKSIASANDYINANKSTDVTLLFNTNDKGEQTPVTWGLDTAWPDEWNIRRGTSFIGKEQLSVGRVSFQPSDLISADGTLSDEQKQDLDERLRLISLTGVKNIALNCDHEVLCDNEEKNFATTEEWEEWKQKAAQHRNNYVGKPTEWIKLFKATTNYCRERGYNVVSIAPFNEADFSAWNQGSMTDFKEICRLMQEDEYFDSIRVSGGNTLNCDEALKWYNGLKSYLDEGNTHQLAGSFDNYANFFTTVRANGHYATADELHNVMEAMVGVEYGMQTGIWWGFDGRARGEYCKATFGERLAYGEDRPNWTAASVYRMPDGRIQAFGGTSERQASNSSYRIVSQDKVAYFDGYGPMHEYIMELPGGTGYQKGQTNAERVVEIHIGEDVPLAPTKGTFTIMNKKSSKVLMPQNSTPSRGARQCQGTYLKKDYQHWNVTPVSSRVGGDFSYFYISNIANEELHLDNLNWSLNNGGEIILFDGNKGNNEQWYFQYAGDSYYYIINRHSGLCLEVAGGSTDNDAPVIQNTINGADQQLWRLLPTGVACEKRRPKAPEGLKAHPTGSTINLSWNANSESDIAGYTILRAKQSDGEWNTIARNIADTTFIDNTVSEEETYIYKIKAIDHSQNRSVKASDTISARTTNENELIAAYTFENSLKDCTNHNMHCDHYGKVNYSVGKDGNTVLQLNGSTSYIQLPTSIAHRQEMTIALWLKWFPGNTWQRIFDFGNGEQQYMCLTTNADNGMMRLSAKNNGIEQRMDICKLKDSYAWQHIAITIGTDKIVAYIDGEEQASSTDITIRTADFNPIFNYVGRSQFENDPLLKGDIDDMRFYNYVLSAKEIERLYKGEDTVIEDLSKDMTITDIRYYTLDGACHNTPQKGVNIIRTHYSDGTVTIDKKWEKE